MTDWEPATDAETAMRDALRAADQELYFRILARTELLLPVSSDALAGRAPMGWGTWNSGGRTHVLAFTSAAAMRICLAEHAGSARKITYHELAAAWPNHDWWLAVNPGMPIEGYLPPWFVTQLARGDVHVPSRSSTGHANGSAGTEPNARGQFAGRSTRSQPPFLRGTAAAGARREATRAAAAAGRSVFTPAPPPPLDEPIEAEMVDTEPPHVRPAGAHSSRRSAPATGRSGPARRPRRHDATIIDAEIIESTVLGASALRAMVVNATVIDASKIDSEVIDATLVDMLVEDGSGAGVRRGLTASSGASATGSPSRIPTSASSHAERIRSHVDAGDDLERTRHVSSHAAHDDDASTTRSIDMATESDATRRIDTGVPRNAHAIRKIDTEAFGDADATRKIDTGVPRDADETLRIDMRRVGPAADADAGRTRASRRRAGSNAWADAAAPGRGDWRRPATSRGTGDVSSAAAAMPATPPFDDTTEVVDAPVGSPIRGTPTQAAPPRSVDQPVGSGPRAAANAPAGHRPADAVPSDGTASSTTAAGSRRTGDSEPSAPTAEPGAPEQPFVPANETEGVLLTAATSGDTEHFLSTLLLAKVLVPVPDGVSTAARLDDPSFPWRREEVEGQPYLVVFTSRERMAEFMSDDAAAITAKFIQLIHVWPDVKWAFAINPGSPVGAMLPGIQIKALAAWADDVGLTDDEGFGEYEGVPAPAPTPNVPTVMQKPVAASQVDYYLDRGYDRVSGFVHRATEVIHVHTPAEMVAALGLTYSGSPFRRDASEVYVLRWAAFRPDLYRIPYGGQTETAMRAMQGWMIERAPFRGNGFAPGEDGKVIAEFKVDSIRLPHGAQMWRLTSAGRKTLIALLDADEGLWRPVRGVDSETLWESAAPFVLPTPSVEAATASSSATATSSATASATASTPVASARSAADPSDDPLDPRWRGSGRRRASGSAGTATGSARAESAVRRGDR